MIRKGTKLYSIFRNKCPRCQEGDFYLSNNSFNLKKIGKMYKYCTNCGLKYTREMGFFYGAMYITYAIGVVIFVAFWIATSVLFPDMRVGVQATVVSAAILILSPINFHLSRLIWINIFYKYKGNKVIDQENLDKIENDNIDNLT